MLVVDPDRDDPALGLVPLRRGRGLPPPPGGRGLLRRGPVRAGGRLLGALRRERGLRHPRSARELPPGRRRVGIRAGGPDDPLRARPILPRGPRPPICPDPPPGARVEVVEDAMPANWWEASAIGHASISRFRLIHRADGRRAGAGLDLGHGGVRPARRPGPDRLTDVEVARASAARGSAGSSSPRSSRHARGQWAEVAEVQARETNRAALALYRASGFAPVDASTLYRRPGPRGG